MDNAAWLRCLVRSLPLTGQRSLTVLSVLSEVPDSLRLAGEPLRLALAMELVSERCHIGVLTSFQRARRRARRGQLLAHPRRRAPHRSWLAPPPSHLLRVPLAQPGGTQARKQSSCRLRGRSREAVRLWSRAPVMGWAPRRFLPSPRGPLTSATRVSFPRERGRVGLSR